MHFANGRRAASPEDSENFQLGSRRFLRRLRHGKQSTTKIFVVSTKIFVDVNVPAARVHDGWIIRSRRLGFALCSTDECVRRHMSRLKFRANVDLATTSTTGQST